VTPRPAHPLLEPHQAPPRAGWMVRLISARLLRLAWLLPLAALIAFMLASLAPVDPINAYVGSKMTLVSPEQRALIAERWGLDSSPAERFLRWAGNLATGDFGVSLIYGQPVADVIAEKFAATLKLMAVAWIVSGFLGFTLGIVAGTWSGSLADRLIRGFAIILASTPTFWVAIVFVYVFGVALGWAPVCCELPPGRLAAEATFAEEIRHLILPAATLSIVGIAPLILHTRQKQIEIMNGEPARLLTAYGASRAGIAFGPGLRNAMGPAIMIHFAGVGELFGGSVLAETVFAWPGLGRATVEAGLRQDVPLLLAAALFTVLFVFVGNLLADIAHGWMDPRLRQAEGAA
jgi:peptide/nickel transport system permease protein